MQRSDCQITHIWYYLDYQTWQTCSMRLSSPNLSHYRLTLLLIGWFVISLGLLYSLLRDSSFKTTLEPTPYRLDLPSWPSTSPGGAVVERLAFDNDWKPVTAVIYQVSTNQSDIIERVHELLEYPFVQQVLIHRADKTTYKLTVQVSFMCCFAGSRTLL